MYCGVSVIYFECDAINIITTISVNRLQSEIDELISKMINIDYEIMK